MTTLRSILLALTAAVAVAALSGCGEKKEVLGDTTAHYGPGVTATKPPWQPEYAHLKQRIAQLRLPPVDKEQVHHHAMVHIYNDGILIPIAPNIGLIPAQHVASSIHTHDSTGIIHMESKVPHNFRLGDLFYIWGVPFGSKSIGQLQAGDGKQIFVYVNGRRVANPANYVLRDQDNVSIGSFPHKPDASALKKVNNGTGTCAKTPAGKPAKSCVAGN
jgi:hypothetical protein